MTMYQGMARVVGIRMVNPGFQVKEKDLRMKIDVLIPQGGTLRDLDFSVKEYGETPVVGEFHSVMVKDTKILLVDI